MKESPRTIIWLAVGIMAGMTHKRMVEIVDKRTAGEIGDRLYAVLDEKTMKHGRLRAVEDPGIGGNKRPATSRRLNGPLAPRAAATALFFPDPSHRRPGSQCDAHPVPNPKRRWARAIWRRKIRFDRAAWVLG